MAPLGSFRGLDGLSRLTRARYRHVVIHTHRADASGTRFTSLKAASRPAGAVLGLQRGPAEGPGGAFEAPATKTHAFRMVPSGSHDHPSTRAARHDRLFEH